MPLDITILFSQWFILLFVAVVLLAFILFLSVKQKKLNKELSTRKGEINEFQVKIESLRDLQKKPKEFMDRLEFLSREYVSKKFGLNANVKFSDMLEFFRTRKNKPALDYFETLEQALFSGEPVDLFTIKSLMMKFEFLVKSSGNLREAKIIEEEENRLIQKREEEKILPLNKLPERDPRVRSYLIEGKKRGFSFNILKQKLLHSGFEESEINYEIEKMLEENKVLNVRQSPDLSKVETILIEKSLNPKKIEIVPYVSEKIEKKAVSYPSQETDKYRRIRSFDDLERIENKISSGRNFP